MPAIPTLRTACLLAALASGCTSAPRLGETLVNSVTAYNEGVRWGRLQTAASHVPPAERADFIDSRDELAEDMHITDYELVRIDPQSDRRARAHVKYTWYREDEGVVRETHADQAWERFGKAWLLVDEIRLRGAAMPGLGERDPAQDELDDDGAAATAADDVDGPRVAGR